MYIPKVHGGASFIVDNHHLPKEAGSCELRIFGTPTRPQRLDDFDSTRTQHAGYCLDQVPPFMWIAVLTNRAGEADDDEA